MTIPVRLGRRGLARLSDGLSERERAVLSSVADHRYLTGRQIETLHFASTEHATPATAARICRRTLARLHQLHVVEHLERRVGGVRAGSASYVWTLGRAGDRLVQLERGEGVRRRFHEPSPVFLDHCLAVADAHLALVSAQRAGQLELTGLQLEPACWRRYLGSGGGSEVLRPDLFLITATASFEDCWFLEVDRGTESLPALLRKCAAYDTYRRSGREQARQGTFPLVVWQLPNQARLTKLETGIVRARGLDASLFRLITPAGLVGLLSGAGS